MDLATAQIPAIAATEVGPFCAPSRRSPPRVQGFEFGDQAWLRGIWREAYLDGMNFMMAFGGVHKRMLEPFSRWVRRAGNQPVLDLASGGGQPIATLLAQARKRGIRLPPITLSDLHPDADAYRRIAAEHPGQAACVDGPVDATAHAVPGPRLFSMCDAFHHFPPEVARKVLAHAGRVGDGIFIQDVFHRRWLSLLLVVFNLPLLMLAPFFSRRFSWRKLLISTVLPIVPLMLMFDGVVSIFRSYRPDEILALVPKTLRQEWRWEAGSCRYMGILSSPYICGYRPVYLDRGTGPTPRMPKPWEAMAGQAVAGASEPGEGQSAPGRM